jgi:hypothetical protein
MMAEKQKLDGGATLEVVDVPKIDRNRLSHKQARTNAFEQGRLAKRMKAAQDAENVDEMEQITAELAALTFVFVAYVPRSWFVDDAPQDISVDTPQWWDYLKQGCYEELAKLVRPQRIGEAPN